MGRSGGGGGGGRGGRGRAAGGGGGAEQKAPAQPVQEDGANLEQGVDEVGQPFSVVATNEQFLGERIGKPMDRAPLGEEMTGPSGVRNLEYENLKASPHDIHELTVTADIQRAVNRSVEPGAQDLSNYASLPPVQNANRYINAQGEVIVGSRGAIELTEAQIGAMSNREAVEYLVNEVGFPRSSVALSNIAVTDMAPTIAALAKGGKYLGEGIEGVGIQLPNSPLAIRVQHGNPNPPLATMYMGKVGVYPEWQKKYGKMWVEAKETIAIQAKYLPSFNVNAPRMRAEMMQNIRSVTRLQTVDAHYGNVGLDYQGRMRVFDQGAFRRVGDDRYAAPD